MDTTGHDIQEMKGRVSTHSLIMLYLCHISF